MARPYPDPLATRSPAGASPGRRLASAGLDGAIKLISQAHDSQAYDYDVAVVGASIAGCTVATLLGRAGARVALLERRPDVVSYKTMCTHFIQASATPTIERLGLAGPIEAAGGIRNGIESWTPYRWVRPQLGGDYRHPRYGYDIRREKLDPMVRGLAAETAGVELMLGRTVTELLGSNGRPEGVRTTDRERRSEDITARVVVAADGRSSEVARMAGVRARVKSHGRFGYFAYYRDLPLVSGHHTLFWFLDPMSRTPSHRMTASR